MAVAGSCADPERRPRPSPDPTTPTGTPSGGTTTPGTTPPTEPPLARLVESGPVTCSNPGLRTALGPWNPQSLAAAPISAAALWGGGVVILDLDRDGWAEVFTAAEGEPRLWRAFPAPSADGVGFVGVHDAVRGLDLDMAVGGTAADLNGDGWIDLVVTRWLRPNKVLLNDGAGGLVDATPPAMAARALRTQSVSVGDLDGDGDLDLFFGSYGARPDTVADPDMPPADPAELYEQVPGGWVDRSSALPQEAHDGYTFASGLYDLDGDGLPEILLANDFGTVRPVPLVHNLGGWTFEPTFPWPLWGTMGLGVGDLNGDAAPDVFFSSWRTHFLMASGEGIGLPGTWIDVTTASGAQLDEDKFGWAVEFADLDNDGDLDAPMLFGYWEEWPVFGARWEADALYEQIGPVQFADRAVAWGFDDHGAGRGMAIADLNHDGYLDIVKRQLDGPDEFLLSRCGERGWLEVQLADVGPNTQGIGATVQIEVGGATQTRWIHAGSSGLYSGHPVEAHFGTASAAAVDRLVVTWPDGVETAFDDVATRQRVVVVRE